MGLDTLIAFAIVGVWSLRNKIDFMTGLMVSTIMFCAVTGVHRQFAILERLERLAQVCHG